MRLRLAAVVLENPGAGDEADDRADPVAHLDVPDDVVHASLLVYC
jgi:hypothetical protein